jgi:predicted nucleic acid-binding protein
MVLVDTSVWVDHLRRTETGLVALLNKGSVLCHPFIIGELACGNLKNRTEVLALLRILPSVPAADVHEVLLLIDEHRLMGKGLGFVDVHLLASALLSSAPLWTFDKRLARAAAGLGIGHPA